MNSIQISILTTPEGIEPVYARLRDMDFEQVEIVDDMASIQAYLEANANYWDYVDEQELAKNGGQTCVRLYVNDDQDGQALVQQIADEMQKLVNQDIGLPLGSLQIVQEIIHEEDWANNWRQFYKPIEVGERLIVVPAWEGNPDNTRIPLRLEPGLVFGTGEHQTTQLCLAALEKTIQPEMDVLDVGSGSGILSITALLLGAKYAVAVDVDPNARNISYENARLNELNIDTYQVHVGDVLQETELQNTIAEEKYDVIVANIVADVILALIPMVKKWMKEESIFISSGIIDERLEEVKAALIVENFAIQSIQEKDGWACIEATLA